MLDNFPLLLVLTICEKILIKHKLRMQLVCSPVGEQYPDVVVLVLVSFSLDTLLALILGVSLFSVGVDERKPRRRAVSADRRGEEVELRVTVHSESLRAEMEPRRFLRG